MADLESLLAEVEATRALGETSTDGLLTAYAALTHRLHEARVAPVTAARFRRDYEDDLMAQRNLIRAEILRRTGDL